MVKSDEHHQNRTEQWSKVKGVFTEISPICEALKKIVRQSEQHAMPISFMDTSQDISQKKLDQLEPSFMYSQIFKEILLSITFEPKHFKQFIQYCRQVIFPDGREPNTFNQFEQEYRNKTPIWWYTYAGFLYDILNRALRVTQVDTLVHMGFFISDLHHHIEQLHQQQFPPSHFSEQFIVYRGQGLSTAQFEQLCKTKGGLLSFNNFLSTSKDRQTSLGFAQASLDISDIIAILFIISIDPPKSTTPFASITRVSCYQDQEDEVLFSMHTVFRIGDVTPARECDGVFEVKLTLTTDDDKDLRQLTDRFRNETSTGNSAWFRLGDLLLMIGGSTKAQQVYEILLQQSTNDDDRAQIYNGLGFAHNNEGYYKEAIIYFEKSLAICQESLPPNHPKLAMSYNNSGAVYSAMGDYTNALLYCEKAFAIQQQSFTPNHPHLADSHTNIGFIHSKMGEYVKALSSYEKALVIRLQSLPPNHPKLATSYNNIGMMHNNMGDNAKALSYYEKGLTIRQQSLLPHHPDVATSYNNIGGVYFNMGHYAKALSYYEKVLTIEQQSLPPNHPDLAVSYNNIGAIHEQLNNYAEALSYYERALTINQKSLPPKSPKYGWFVQQHRYCSFQDE